MHTDETRKIKWLPITAGLLCFIICLFFSKDGYELLFILPLSFAFVIGIFSNIVELAKKYIGIKIFYFTLWLRYIVMPICISLSSEITGIGVDPQTKYIIIAIIIMAIELFITCVTITLYGNRRLRRHNFEQTFILQKTDNRKSYLVHYIIILISILFIVVYPNLLNNFSFAVYDGSGYTISFLRGIDIRLIQVSIMLVFCMIVEKTRIKHVNSNNNKGYYLASFVGLAVMLIMKGENRASLLVGIVSVFVTLYAAFPNKRKTTTRLIMTVGGVALISLSLYRILAVTAWRPQGGILDINISSIARTLQAYMAGPRNIAIGLQAANTYSANFNTFISDIFIWSGYIGNFLSETLEIQFQGTSFLYNKYLYGPALTGSGDQIVPMVNQSIWYFGYIGSMFFSTISALLIVKFDEFICKSKSVDMIYINTIMATITGLMMGYNISILSLYFFDKYLFYYLIVSVANLYSNHIRFKTR